MGNVNVDLVINPVKFGIEDLSIEELNIVYESLSSLMESSGFDILLKILGNEAYNAYISMIHLNEIDAAHVNIVRAQVYASQRLINSLEAVRNDAKELYKDKMEYLKMEE